MWALKHISLLTVFCLAISGCVHELFLFSIKEGAPYPSAWPSSKTAATEDGCPNLTGTYENKSFEVLPIGAREVWSLSEIFKKMLEIKGSTWPGFVEASRVLDDATAVSFMQKDGFLFVKFFSANRASTELKLHPFFTRPKNASIFWKPTKSPDIQYQYFSEFLCGNRGDGPLLGLGDTLNSVGDTSSWTMDAGQDTFIYLLKASDGSLVLHWHEESRDGLPIILFAPTQTRYKSTWIRFRLLSSNS